MQNIWNYISNLGTTGDNIQKDQRTIVLTNQINLVMFITMLLLLPYTYFTLQATNEAMYIGTLRVALLLIVNFLNLVLARFGYTRLSKLSIIYAPAVVFLLLPTMIGYVEEESYTYYPYIVIGTSIIPQLLLHPQKEKFHYWFSLCLLFGNGYIY